MLYQYLVIPICRKSCMLTFNSFYDTLILEFMCRLSLLVSGLSNISVIKSP
uniref:Uncharacterized protein n=1 Tax=Arundo donax TaxID=35708 RepID=A0A0A9HAC6_ARUDO